MHIDNSKSNVGTHRYSYGIGSGSSTVGGDVETTKTKPLTKCMKKMCQELTKVKEINCFKDKNNNVVVPKTIENHESVQKQLKNISPGVLE